MNILEEWQALEPYIISFGGLEKAATAACVIAITPADPRIDMARLTTRLGALPHEPEKQSALWFATYRKHDKELSVMDANGAYLLYREMAALVPFVGFVSFGLALALPSARGNLEVVGAILLLEYAVLMLATRNAGTRLVSNVLAVEAAISEKKGAATVSKPPFPKRTRVK